MYKAVVITEYGESKVLQIKKIKLRKISDNEVLIKHDYIGVNYYDVKQRKGLIAKSKLPLILGCEGIGTVEEISTSEKMLKVGNKVCYVNAPNGAYCEKRVISNKYIIPIPDDISPNALAGCLHKIVTAHSLMTKVFCVRKNMSIMVHDVCGNIGRFIAQIGSIIGCKVIGTVKSEEHNSIAEDFGCDIVLNHTDPQVYKKVLEYTEGRGVAVVYDPLPKKDISLRSLAIFGSYVVYEQNFGIVQNISWKALNARSLFYSAPSVFHYQGDPIMRIIDIREIFELIKQKKFKGNVGKRYSLEEVRQAHDDLESGGLVGPGVIFC